MKKLAAIILLTILAKSSNAQHIINLSHLDYISADAESLNGYRKDGDKYTKYSYQGYMFAKDSLMLSESESDSIDETVVGVLDIPKMSICDWEKLLDEHDLIWTEDGDDSSELSLIVKKSRYFVLSQKLSYDEETSRYKEDGLNLKYGYVCINNNKYNNLESNNQFNISYIKLKDDKYLLCLINEFNTYKVIPDKEYLKSKLSFPKLDDELKKNVIEYLSAPVDFAQFHILQRENQDKYTIVNDKNMPIGIAGDTIISCQGAVAIYDKTENSYRLYDPFLNEVKHSHKVRLAKADCFTNSLTLLIGNKLVPMVGSKVGENLVRKVKAAVVCGTVGYYKDSIAYVDRTIRLEQTKDYRMLGKGMEYYNFDIVNAQAIDSLFFYGMAAQEHYSDNTSKHYINNQLNTKDILCAKKNTGKYNLYTYKEISNHIYKQTEETYKNILDKEVGRGEPKKVYSEGKIELFPLLSKDVDSIKMYSYPATYIAYKEDGLWGVYGVSAKAKYILLGAPESSRLMRYELPDGRKGWLDLSSGKEFNDI